MSKMSSRETWASVGLGLVCVVLLARLVVNSASVSAKSETSPRAVERHIVRSGAKTGRKIQSEFPTAPVLRTELLKQEEGQPLEAPDRDPFQFAPTPDQVRQAMAKKAMVAGGQPAAPPTAPPIPYKALGYSENAHGQFQGYLTDDKDIFVIHEGDELNHHYRILKITPNLVEVQDEAFNQKSQLLFPQ